MIYSILRKEIKMNILYIDLETTGLNAQKNGVWQIAGAIEIGGEIKDEFDFKCQTVKGDVIDDKALKVGGITREQLMSFEDPFDTYRKLVKVFERHVNKFNFHERFYIGGYNVHFDVDFISNWFKKFCNDKYGFGSWTNWRKIDPISILHWLAWTGQIRLDNYKLQTVCDAFGVKLTDAHDAKADIRATIELIQRIRKKFVKAFEVKGASC